jgi:uncharacterized membrane protein (DUF485 family)
MVPHMSVMCPRGWPDKVMSLLAEKTPQVNRFLKHVHNYTWNMHNATRNSLSFYPFYPSGWNRTFSKHETLLHTLYMHTQDLQWRYTCGFIEMYTSLSVFLCKSNVGYFFDWLTASSYGTITVGSIITHAFGHTITYWLIASLYSCFAQVWN